MRIPAISIAAVLVKGRVLETILNTEQGVASCGSGSQPLSREVRDPARRALRPGREELAVTDPEAILVREARDRSPKPPRWSAGRRASPVWDARRLARRLACRVTCRPHGCLASTRTTLGAPPTPSGRGIAFGHSGGVALAGDMDSEDDSRIGMGGRPMQKFKNLF